MIADDVLAVARRRASLARLTLAGLILAQDGIRYSKVAIIFYKKMAYRLGALALVAVWCASQALAEAVLDPGKDIDSVGCDVLMDRGTGYGPYDYTNSEHRKNYLSIVERHHFSSNVQFLLKGDSSAFIWDDLVFVVKAFPNHHRALAVMVKHRLANKPLSPGANRIECYFANAFSFKSDDAQVYLIFAQYLAKTGAHEQALRVFKKHESMKSVSSERDLSLGMLYFDMKQYAKARALAEKLSRNQNPNTELKDKLISVDQWTGAKPEKKQ